MKYLLDLLVDSLIGLVKSISIAILLILGIGLPVMGMFGIAALIDNYSKWYFLLLIPYFLILSMVCVLLERADKKQLRSADNEDWEEFMKESA